MQSKWRQFVHHYIIYIKIVIFQQSIMRKVIQKYTNIHCCDQIFIQQYLYLWSIAQTVCVQDNLQANYRLYCRLCCWRASLLIIYKPALLLVILQRQVLMTLHFEGLLKNSSEKLVYPSFRVDGVGIDCSCRINSKKQVYP